MREVIVVAIYDTWDWTPECDKTGARVDPAITIVDRLLESTVAYLEANPDVLIGTLAKLAGWRLN